MITLEKAIELATKAHEGQYRRPKTVVTDSWDCYKTKEPIMHENGNKIHWVIQDTFLVYEPYITHPLALMEMMDTEEEKIVAVLHDAIEDTEATLYPHDGLFIKYKDLRYELTKEVYAALHSITKWKCDGKTYEEHIRDISKNKLATKIKLADIFHNMSCEPSERAKKKYLKAIPVLLKGI